MKALSPTDSAFLWMETRNQPMHVAGLNIYTPPPGARPDFIPKMLEAWGQHIRAQSPFNLRPVLRMGLWHWQEDKDFELDSTCAMWRCPSPDAFASCWPWCLGCMAICWTATARCGKPM